MDTRPPDFTVNNPVNNPTNTDPNNCLLIKCYLIKPRLLPQENTALQNRTTYIIDNDKTYLNNSALLARVSKETEAAEALLMLQDCGNPQLANCQQSAISNNETHTSKIKVTRRHYYKKFRNSNAGKLETLTQQSFNEIHKMLEIKKLKIPDNLELFENKITNNTGNSLFMIKKNTLDIADFFRKLILFYKFNMEKEQKYSLNIMSTFIIQYYYNEPNPCKSCRIRWNNLVAFVAMPDDKIEFLLDDKNVRREIHEACNNDYIVKLKVELFKKFNLDYHLDNYLKGLINNINCKFSDNVSKKLFKTNIKEIIELFKIKNIKVDQSFYYLLDVLIKNQTDYKNEMLEKIFITIISRLQKIPDENNFYDTSMIFKVEKHNVNLKDGEKIINCQQLDNNICDSSKKRKASIDIDEQRDQPKRAKYLPTDENKLNLV